MEQELKDHGKFKDFYQFTFNFAKNPGQKGLGKNVFMLIITLTVCLLHVYQPFLYSFFFFFTDLEMAIAYWNLVLAGRFKFLELWNKFLIVCLIITLKITFKNVSIIAFLDLCLAPLAGTPQASNS